MPLTGGSKSAFLSIAPVQRLQKKGCGAVSYEESVMMKDPVCGADVDERKIPAISTYYGRHYLFCGQECKNTFDENPDEYLPTEELLKIAQRRSASTKDFRQRSLVR
jgi:YHS domain-containing protein